MKKKISKKKNRRSDFRKAAKILSKAKKTQENISDSLLVSGIAHEFNNILGAADGHAEWALEENTLEATMEALKIVRMACARSFSITKALQGLKQQREESFDRFFMSEALSEVQSFYGPLLEHKSLLLKIPSQNKDFKIFTSRSDLVEILMNLVKNAFEVLQDPKNQKVKIGNEVNLKVEKRARTILIKVSDQGPGIADFLRPQLFRPFFSTKGVVSSLSLDGTQTGSEGQGTQTRGLGLYFSKILAGRLAGRLYLARKAEKAYATTFVLEIPI